MAGTWCELNIYFAFVLPDERRSVVPMRAYTYPHTLYNLTLYNFGVHHAFVAYHVIHNSIRVPVKFDSYG